MILVGLVFVLSGCSLFGVDQAANTKENAEKVVGEVADKMDKVAEKMDEAGGGDPFDGTMEAAMKLGVPMKCTVETDEVKSTTYVKGENFYSEMMVDGKESRVIVKDNCMWSWTTENETQGIKMCFEDDIMESDEYEEYSGSTPDVDYHCLPAVITDSKFTPPSDIEFTDMDAFMNGSMNIDDLQNMAEDFEQ